MIECSETGFSWDARADQPLVLPIGMYNLVVLVQLGRQSGAECWMVQVADARRVHCIAAEWDVITTDSIHRSRPAAIGDAEKWVADFLSGRLDAAEFQSALDHWQEERAGTAN